MTVGNVNGVEVRVFNREREMAVFDCLPPVLRDELRSTSVAYSAIEVGELLTGGHSVVTVLSVLRGENTRIMAAYRRRIAA
jgi:hypothetical protein